MNRWKVKTMEKEFYKLVCVDESDPFEYKILEDVNKGSLDEVHKYVMEKSQKHIGAKWMLIPYICKN